MYNNHIINIHKIVVNITRVCRRTYTSFRRTKVGPKEGGLNISRHDGLNMQRTYNYYSVIHDWKHVLLNMLSKCFLAPVPVVWKSFIKVIIEGSGVHKGGFSKGGGGSNNNVTTTHRLLNPPLLNLPL